MPFGRVGLRLSKLSALRPLGDHDADGDRPPRNDAEGMLRYRKAVEQDDASSQAIVRIAADGGDQDAHEWLAAKRVVASCQRERPMR